MIYNYSNRARVWNYNIFKSLKFAMLFKILSRWYELEIISRIPKSMSFNLKHLKIVCVKMEYIYSFVLYEKFCTKIDRIILSIYSFEFSTVTYPRISSALYKRLLHQAYFLRASFVCLGPLKHCPAVIVKR